MNDALMRMSEMVERTFREARQMTESEWLSSDDPMRMLQCVTAGFDPCMGIRKDQQKPFPYKISDRKLRLFVAAVTRIVFPVGYYLITEAEAIAEGNIDLLNDAHWPTMRSASEAAMDATRFSPVTTANLLRDIVGNPWRPVYWIDDPKRHVGDRPRPETVPRVVMRRTWITPTVLAIAQAAYEERPGRKCGECDDGVIVHERDMSSDRRCDTCNGTGRINDGAIDNGTLSVLADALEDAGCDNEAILAHLRSPGPHVRGCFVLDLILGKE